MDPAVPPVITPTDGTGTQQSKGQTEGKDERSKNPSPNPNYQRVCRSCCTHKAKRSEGEAPHCPCFSSVASLSRSLPACLTKTPTSQIQKNPNLDRNVVGFPSPPAAAFGDRRRAGSPTASRPPSFPRFCLLFCFSTPPSRGFSRCVSGAMSPLLCSRPRFGWSPRGIVRLVAARPCALPREKKELLRKERGFREGARGLAAPRSRRCSAFRLYTPFGGLYPA